MVSLRLKSEAYCEQALLPLGVPREAAASRLLQLLRTPGVPRLVAASVHPLCPSPLRSSCVGIPLLSPVTGSGRIWTISVQDQRPRFQTRSHSEVPGRCNSGGHCPPHSHQVLLLHVSQRRGVRSGEALCSPTHLSVVVTHDQRP